jgi:hypothetical protein
MGHELTGLFGVPNPSLKSPNKPIQFLVGDKSIVTTISKITGAAIITRGLLDRIIANEIQMTDIAYTRSLLDIIDLQTSIYRLEFHVRFFKIQWLENIINSYFKFTGAIPSSPPITLHILLDANGDTKATIQYFHDQHIGEQHKPEKPLVIGCCLEWLDNAIATPDFVFKSLRQFQAYFLSTSIVGDVF